MIDLNSGDIKNSDKLAFVLFSFLKEDCFMDYKQGTGVLPKSKDITVLIPCYGKADTVERAVKSALNQSMEPFQVIILLMDEKSVAKSKDLSELDKKVKCVESERLNVCAARNKLAELCPTEYFIFLDADDELCDNFIEETYKAEGSIVFTPCVFSRTDIKDVSFDLENKERNAFIDNSFTCLMNKTAFRDIGGFNEAFKNGVEDTDLILRLLLQKKYKISFAGKGRFIYYECSTGLTKSVEFFNSALVALNSYLPTFKKLYGRNKRTLVPQVYDLLQKKDLLTKEDLHYLFNELSGKEIEDLEGCEVTAYTSGLFPRNEMQKTSFVLDLRCDRKCPYCFQREEAGICGTLSDDEIFDHFDKALTKCETLLGYLPIVQLLGGEPTLWSDYLVRKIQARLSSYSSYLVFSNGYNKDSLFWKDPKAVIDYHITDWEKCEPLEPLPENVKAKIVVTKKNIGLVDAFLKANKGTTIQIAFSHDAGEEYDLEIDDIRKLAEIEYENRDFIPVMRRRCLAFYEQYRRRGLKGCQDFCKKFLPIWIFLCYNDTVMTCYSRTGDSYPLDEFTGQETKDCGNCFMFY